MLVSFLLEFGDFGDELTAFIFHLFEGLDDLLLGGGGGGGVGHGGGCVGRRRLV